MSTGRTTVALIGLAAMLFGGGGKRRRGPTTTGELEDDATRSLDDLLQDTPTKGALYRVRRGDIPVTVASRALGSAAGSAAVAAYVRAMTASRWNWALYGVQGAGPYSYDWAGTRGVLAAAYYPGNDNVHAAVAAGSVPRRRYQWSRAQDPNTSPPRWNPPRRNAANAHGRPGYGVLWLPDYDAPRDPDSDAANPMPLLRALDVSPEELHEAVGA